jgi:hypothetical protein
MELFVVACYFNEQENIVVLYFYIQLSPIGLYLVAQVIENFKKCLFVYYVMFY